VLELLSSLCGWLLLPLQDASSGALPYERTVIIFASVHPSAKAFSAGKVPGVSKSFGQTSTSSCLAIRFPRALERSENIEAPDKTR
jgi:hypothetical protein